MGKNDIKFVARAMASIGWQIWNRKTERPWGNPFSTYPEELLAELNGLKRPERIVALSKRK